MRKLCILVAPFWRTSYVILEEYVIFKRLGKKTRTIAETIEINSRAVLHLVYSRFYALGMIIFNVFYAYMERSRTISGKKTLTIIFRGSIQVLLSLMQTTRNNLDTKVFLGE